ncbi:hypothetical protein [Pelagicoccus albus]|uniref:Uncharacterized protein n=1 Tax=Pelagicoccus albus TaxID=415222 RepID=A0A7X1B4A9_9BACT|nr:hypothetical protein [Pelagicoccus albus]MBC2605366.1 hypothetical protein [Pelagicoccus albus]
MEPNGRPPVKAPPIQGDPNLTEADQEAAIDLIVDLEEEQPVRIVVRHAHQDRRKVLKGMLLHLIPERVTDQAEIGKEEGDASQGAHPAKKFSIRTKAQSSMCASTRMTIAFPL